MKVVVWTLLVAEYYCSLKLIPYNKTWLIFLLIVMRKVPQSLTIVIFPTSYIMAISPFLSLPFTLHLTRNKNVSTYTKQTAYLFKVSRRDVMSLYKLLTIKSNSFPSILSQYVSMAPSYSETNINVPVAKNGTKIVQNKNVWWNFFLWRH